VVAAVCKVRARALNTEALLTRLRPLAGVVVRRSGAALTHGAVLAAVVLEALAGGVGHDALAALRHKSPLLCVHPPAVRAVSRANRGLAGEALVAGITLALASGVVTLAALGTVLRAGDESAHGAHEGGGAGARAVAISGSVADSVITTVLIAQALVALLAGPTLLAHALEVIALAVLATLAADCRSTEGEDRGRECEWREMVSDTALTRRWSDTAFDRLPNRTAGTKQAI
jgi:hypothetical protein